ncbi:MAG: hypothetical protein WD534_17460 [Phycisphaeraceae bacterium]
MPDNTHICTQCGYELTGLGTRGRCPECGQYFDQHSREGVDDTATPLVRLGRWTDRHLRTIVLGVTGLLLLTCAGLVTLLAGLDGLRAAAIATVLLSVFALALVASYVDEM